MRYDVKNHPIHSCIYEKISLDNVRSTNNPLGRTVIATIQYETRLVEIIRNAPAVHNDPNQCCRPCITQTLSGIAQDDRVTGTVELDWGNYEAVAREYVASKTAAGRYLDAADMALLQPTYDMLERKEVVPILCRAVCYWALCHISVCKNNAMGRVS